MFENYKLIRKYPFLLLRNRFTNEVRSSWDIEYTLYNKAYTSISVNIKHVDESIPITYKSIFKDDYFISFTENKLVIEYDILGNRQSKIYELPIDRDLYDVIAIKICNNYMGNPIIIVEVHKKEGKNKYGWPFKSFTFIKSKFYKRLLERVKSIRKFWNNHFAKFFLKYTELDAMPYGWRKAFGLQMCEEIKQALINSGSEYLKNYRIEQIKEKYGGLRWYDANSTKEIQDIISKYENMSYRTCINCGKPAKYMSRGWISPYCEDCIGDKENANLLDSSGSE